MYLGKGGGLCCCAVQKFCFAFLACVALSGRPSACDTQQQLWVGMLHTSFSSYRTDSRRKSAERTRLNRRSRKCRSGCRTFRTRYKARRRCARLLSVDVSFRVRERESERMIGTGGKRPLESRWVLLVWARRAHGYGEGPPLLSLSDCPAPFPQISPFCLPIYCSATPGLHPPKPHVRDLCLFAFRNAISQRAYRRIRCPPNPPHPHPPLSPLQ